MTRATSMSPPWDLDPAAEETAFQALKLRLAGLWGDVFPGDDEHYTSVVVPSRSVDPRSGAPTTRKSGSCSC